MKKIVSLILLCIFALMLSGCGNEKIYHWEFEKESSRVTEIQIIVTPNNERFDINTYKILKEIDLSYADEMYDDVGSITMTRQHGGMRSLGGLSILIKFDNGEYDVISNIGASHYKYDKNSQMVRYPAWLTADVDEFLGVISKYLALD